MSRFELMALGCAFLWALNALVLRRLSSRASPAAMNGIRCGAAGVAFLVWLPFHQAPTGLAEVPLVEWGILAVSLLSGIIVGDTLYLVALREIGVARAMPLSGIFPLTTLLFERLLLQTPLQPGLLAGSALVATGVVLMTRGRVPTQEQGVTPGRLGLGVVCALAAALLWGFGVTLLKPALAHLTQVQANAVRMPLVALVLYVAVVRPSGERLGALSWQVWCWLAGTGLLGMGLGAYMFLTALDELGPTKLVTLTSASPLFGLVLAVVFLGERIDVRVLAGAACCVGGVWAVL